MKNTNEFPKEKNVNFLSLARSVPCEIQYQGLGWGAILYSDPDFKVSTILSELQTLPYFRVQYRNPQIKPVTEFGLSSAFLSAAQWQPRGRAHTRRRTLSWPGMSCATYSRPSHYRTSSRLLLNGSQET